MMQGAFQKHEIALLLSVPRHLINMLAVHKSKGAGFLAELS